LIAGRELIKEGMQPAQPPSDEQARLAALRSYEILDTPAEMEFDDFTWLASQICGTPIALISLVDAERQWFKSKVGIDAEETPREVAFCAHAILDNGIFEVPNALEDERFVDNPLVTGAPDIRFYAGMPLTTPGGHNLGTLCVIDRVPGRLSALQRESLMRLGRQVVAQMELRIAKRQLQAANRELETYSRELSAKNAAMEEDLRMARELQMALLPQRFPTLPRDAVQSASAVRFCSVFHPASSVGGDFFNVVRVSETAVGVFICDVMGHGVRAALVTAMMRALGEQLGDAAGNPGALLTEINRGLSSILQQSGTTLFATACYLIADVARSRISYANAGHPSPLLLRSADGGVVPLTAPHTAGPALGLFADAQYLTHEHPVEARDLILLFTDGLFEVENGRAEAFGESRLRESIRLSASLPPARVVHHVFTEVERFAEGQAFADDVCFVGMEIAHLAANPQ